MLGVVLHQEVFRPQVDSDVDPGSLLSIGAVLLIRTQDPVSAAVNWTADVALTWRACPMLTAGVHRTLGLTVIRNTAEKKKYFLLKWYTHFIVLALIFKKEDRSIAGAKHILQEFLQLDYFWYEIWSRVKDITLLCFLSWGGIYACCCAVSVLTWVWTLCYYWRAKTFQQFELTVELW